MGSLPPTLFPTFPPTTPPTFAPVAPSVVTQPPIALAPTPGMRETIPPNFNLGDLVLGPTPASVGRDGANVPAPTPAALEFVSKNIRRPSDVALPANSF